MDISALTNSVSVLSTLGISVIGALIKLLSILS